MTALLLISGSTRGGSTNTAALRTAVAVAPAGVRAVLWDGLADLPAFNPDQGPEGVHPAVAGLRAEVAAAAAVLFCTPEYAGNLPGSLKNALDWLVGSGELYRKPVAWINVAAPGRGEGAHAALRGVLGYVDAAVVEAACARVQVTRDAVGADGHIAAGATRDAIAGVLCALAESTQLPAGD
jgi:chromate reductase, NAD(P)H dehydrogenase (quinone)